MTVPLHRTVHSNTPVTPEYLTQPWSCSSTFKILLGLSALRSLQRWGGRGLRTTTAPFPEGRGNGTTTTIWTTKKRPARRCNTYSQFRTRTSQSSNVRCLQNPQTFLGILHVLRPQQTHALQTRIAPSTVLRYSRLMLRFSRGSFQMTVTPARHLRTFHRNRRTSYWMRVEVRYFLGRYMLPDSDRYQVLHKTITPPRKLFLTKRVKQEPVSKSIAASKTTAVQLVRSQGTLARNPGRDSYLAVTSLVATQLRSSTEESNLN